MNAASTSVFSTTNTINLSHPSVPPGTPEALFKTHRWDPTGSAEMEWNFPVTPGNYEVRLYFSEIWDGAFSEGARIFDVFIEGDLKLNDYDVFAEAGADKGIVTT